MDLTEAEGLADLLEAETESQRKAALTLAEGGLRRQIAMWQEQLLALSARAERAIDYDEEDQALDPSLLRDSAVLARELEQWLARPRAEPLKDGVLVVVAGPPNAGQSSLLNAIAGEERAIVTDLPGTTRDHLEVPLSLGGVPIRLTDTAGLRAADNQVEAIGVARAERLIEAADVLVWLGDAADVPPHARVIVVHAKADLPGRREAPDGVWATSAVSGEGLSELMAEIGRVARTVLPAEDAIALNRRQAAHVAEAALALSDVPGAGDLVFVAEHFRRARYAFDQLTGAAGVENVLDTLFARFCLGK
jgi:tRNA modification GTPase